jgi:2,3-bisphosphoglycerate-independent phosphoglycerate mutase
MPVPRPVMLVILDGFGWREEEADNAVRLARAPTFEWLWTHCPHAFLKTSGLDVGLPDGQMGNSEVGHMNIGAGRVVMQELPRISAACADGSLARAPALRELIASLKASGGTCHLMGLVSPGGVHSHQDHAVALAIVLTSAGIPVAVHAFMDGRDTPPRSGGEYIRSFAAALPAGAPIATVCGRYYAMDRDKRWERVTKAYLALTEGQGVPAADGPAAMDAAYASDVGDEFVIPAVIGNYKGMRDGDGILCFNFRADRVRELLSALTDPAFAGFPRPRPIRFAAMAGMTPYSEELDTRLGALFPPESLDGLLGQVVARAGLRQLRMAETEKYPHVTYFLNGGDEPPNPSEDRLMVPSPKVATYDLQPEMSAPELTEKAVEQIDSGKYDLIVLNFANADMVGHTGSLPAAIKAVETVDGGLERILAAIQRQGGALMVTADHGNAEQMRDPDTGGPYTAHTTNPVPVVLANTQTRSLHDGRLADIAPTLLSLMGLPRPPQMTGRPLTDG